MTTRELRASSKRVLALLDFMIHSAAQAYGRTFIWRVVLRHPWHTLRGMVAYARMLHVFRPRERVLLRCDESEFVRRAAMDPRRLLVATGFCQKPADTADSVHNCPVGRFTHNCLYLKSLRLSPASVSRILPGCADCAILQLGQAALAAGASFAVLTSALDIAQDILLPALEQRRFTHFLFAVCPLSVEPMSLALLTCGLEGYIFPYDTGACVDYNQWLRADGGDKPERTTLTPHSTVRVRDLLQRIAACRDERLKGPVGRYEREGDIFVPRWRSSPPMHPGAKSQ